MAVKNLLIRGGADFSGIQKEVARTQRTLSGFQSNVSSVMKKVSLALGGLAIGKLVKDSTQMAMSVESAMDNINRTMKSSAASFQNWVDTQAKGMGIAKAEAYKYGSTYSNLLSSFIGSSDNVASETEELMKATAIIASKTGRTYEDTAERIRSGMLGSTEAIEDLGVYTQVSMLESTAAFKKFANGKSWAQLDFQAQQQIRLAAILEQTYARYGDTLADTTQTRQSQFIASLKNIQLSLGQAFLPIYNAILPPLTSFMNSLGKVINLIAQFTQALFGKPKSAKAQTEAVSSQAAAVTGLGDSAEEASKKAKKAAKTLAGFDELNTLGNSSSSDDSDSSGAGSVSTPTLDTGGLIDNTVEVSDKIQAMANKVKGAFATMQNAFDYFKNKLIENKEVIISAISGIIGALSALGIILIVKNWSALVKIFAVTKQLSPVMKALSLIMSSISVPIVLVSAAIGLLIANIIYLWQTNEGFRNSVIEVWNSICSFVTKIAGDMWSIVKGIWDKYGQTLLNNLKGFMGSIQAIIVRVWESVIKPLITNALSLLTWLWNSHFKILIQTVGEFVMKLINNVLEIWNKCFAPLIGWLVDKLGPIFVNIFTLIGNVIGSKIAYIVDVIKGLIRVFGGLIDFITGVFTGNWSKAWQGVKDIFGGIFNSLVGVIKYPLNLIIDAINFVLGGLNKISFSTPDWVPDWLGGGKTFGINIPKIPKLAQGGYVGANNPMLAMIGDNTQEGEIVAPESKIYEQTFNAISDALKMSNNNSNDNLGNLTLMIDSSVIGEVALNQLRRMQRQGGITLIPT